MASILITSTPVIGHVNPLLPVAQTLVEAGHRVRFLTGRRYRDAVEQTGAEYLPLPSGADFDDRRIDEQFPGRVGLTGPAGIRYDMTEIFLRPMPQQLAAIDAAIAAEPVDVVLAESLFFGVLPLLTRPREQRPAVINLGIVPLGLLSRDTAPFGLGVQPMPGPFGRLRNRMLTFVATKVIFAPVQREAERLVEQLTGSRMPQFLLNWLASADAVIQFTVPGFEYARSDLTTEVHFVGPVSRSSTGAHARPDWWGDLDSGKPVVHVSQGTVANQDFEELLLPTLRGLADRDVLVVASTGGRPVDALGELPANARVAEYLPYDELFTKTDAFVTNGGYGGIHFALRHGVPIVVAGLTEDKVEVSARVAWSGVGIDLHSNRPAPADVAKAVDGVLAEPSFRAAAARVGAEIAASPGAAGILPVIESHARAVTR